MLKGHTMVRRIGIWMMLLCCAGSQAADIVATGRWCTVRAPTVVAWTVDQLMQAIDICRSGDMTALDRLCQDAVVAKRLWRDNRVWEVGQQPVDDGRFTGWVSLVRSEGSAQLWFCVSRVLCEGSLPVTESPPAPTPRLPLPLLEQPEAVVEKIPLPDPRELAQAWREALDLPERAPVRYTNIPVKQGIRIVTPAERWGVIVNP